jgi:hypothetical protein
VSPTAKLEDFRQTVELCTKASNQILAVSYSRQVLGQTGTGHFSPIGGYHKQRDLVLVMDTARFKYPPHWVSVPLLFDAMKEVDPDTGLLRGYFLTSKAPAQPQILFQLNSALSITQVSAANDDDTNALLAGIRVWMNWLKEPSTDDSLSSAIDLISQHMQRYHLLNIQCSESCNGLSDDHACALKIIIREIESHPIYQTISQHQSSDLSACCKLSIISPNHLITMLLFSWPYEVLNPSSNAFHLASVAKVNQVGSPLYNEIQGLKRVLEGILGYINKCQSCDCSPRKTMLCSSKTN